MEEDAYILYKWRNDDEIWRYTTKRPDIVSTPETELKWIREVLKRDNEKRFAICISETDEYIGNVQLTNINSQEGEFHIFIGEKKYFGYGYGTAATLELIKYAFNDLKLQSIYLDVRPQNINAVKLYKKVGFKEIVWDNEENIRMVLYPMNIRNVR
jgi:RimJ/RimL family protein N-acetyltransferase